MDLTALCMNLSCDVKAFTAVGQFNNPNHRWIVKLFLSYIAKRDILILTLANIWNPNL